MKKKSFARRHFILTSLFILVFLLVGSVALLLWGGPMITDIASIGARKYLSSLEHLNIAFDNLSGDLFNGYVLEGVTVGNKEKPDTITLKHIMVALDAKESWANKKAVMSAELSGLRINENEISNITEAAQKDFPPAQTAEEKPKDAEPFPVFKYVLPKKFTATDLAGAMGWKVENLNVELPDFDKLCWDVGLAAEYKNEPINLDGAVALTQEAMPEGADLRVRVLDCDLSVSASLKDGLITLKNIDGLLFSSPIKGNASINTAIADPTVIADIDLKKINFDRLKKWLPDLGHSTLEGFTAKVNGTLSKPVGTVSLKNGNLAYQSYKVSNLNGNVELDGKKSAAKLSANAFGADISVSGNAEIDPKGKVDVKADINSLDLSKVSAAVPQLKSVGLSGLVSADANVSGTIDDPKVSAKINSSKISAMEGYTITDLATVLNATMKKAIIESLSLNAFGAHVTASGNASLSPNGALDIKANIDSLDLKNVSASVPAAASADLHGIVTAAATATGTLSDPKINLTLSSPKITAMKTYTLSDIKAAISAGTKQADIENFSLNAFKGQISAKGKIGFEGGAVMDLHGRIHNIDLSAAVPGGTVKGIANSDFDITGTAKNPQINFDAKIDTLEAAQVGLKEIDLKVNGGQTLNISLNGQTQFNTPFGGGGTVKLPLGGAKSALDLTFNLDKMNVSELLPNTFKYRAKYGGDIAADITVKGTFEKPQLSAELRSEELEASGYTIYDTRANAKLNGKTVKFDASVAMGDRRPKITGTVNFAKGLKCDINVDAPTVSVSALHPSLEGMADGRISLSSKGTITDKSINFSGRVSSPVVNVLIASTPATEEKSEATDEQAKEETSKSSSSKSSTKKQSSKDSTKKESQNTATSTTKVTKIPIENILATFKYKDGIITVPTGQVGLGGSVIKLKLDGNVNNATYNFSANGKSIDLAKLTKPLNLPAKVTGKAGVEFEGSARTGLTTILQGNGKISMNDVAVDEFPGQGAVTGSDPFRIKSGSIHANLNDGELYIMPGSAISAPSDDNVYHFISFTGTAWKQARSTPKLDASMLPKDLLKRTGDMYHMYIDGSVNMRVLNSVLGGLGAVMEAGESGDLSAETIGTNMLKNMITGGIIREFRQFTLDIAGKTYSDTPKINKLKFEGTGSYADVDSTSWTEDAAVSNEQKYGFSYPVPVGRDPQKIKTKSSKSSSSK